jgi:hypothetical protein
MADEGEDDLEPFHGKFDWNEAFAQNPDLPVFDVPTAERERVHGQETAEDAEARVLPGEVEAWLSIAHLDRDDDEEDLDPEVGD